MHLQLILVGLAALTAAAPLDKISDSSMHQAQDTDNTKYADYHPYHSYEPYSSAVEAEAAKMQQGKLLARHLFYSRISLITYQRRRLRT
jgi:hypothetical protein